eukprot:7852550-Alexandrium_andersonii.AAC.1
MSASLVGSEMCIRDRANVQRIPFLGDPDQRLDVQPEDEFQPIIAQPTGCLLYTSDAADDM